MNRIPRQPTVTELKEMYVLEAELADNTYANQLRHYIACAYIAVFDDNITHCPVSAEKVMIVAWPDSPESSEIYIWHKGQITRLEEQPI